MKTKREIIIDAFEEAGLSSYTYDLEVEEIQSALRNLNALASSLDLSSTNFGYNTGGGLDDNSGIPDGVYLAIYMLLARSLAGKYGKQLTPQQSITLSTAVQSLYAWKAKNSLGVMANDSRMPLGAGNKQYRYQQNFQDAALYSLDDGNEY